MNKIALISVSDKTDIDLLASKLVKNGYTIISTGGTASYLQEKGINIIPISKFTKFEEILGGRVKTLHPKIHAGILNKRSNKSHQREMKKNDIENNFIPGKVVSEKVIACGDSAIEILSVKPEGKKVMYIEDYLRGNSMSVGEILE